jgi:hypothetical protein
MAKTLKNLLRDELVAKRVMTVDEVCHLAVVNQFKPSSAERYLRARAGKTDLPIVKLDAKNKPAFGNTRVYGISYMGAKTVFQKNKMCLQKRPKRNKQYA